MDWRYQTSTRIVEDWPYLPRHCNRRCECPAMWWRAKVTHRFGGAQLCSINIASYDPLQSGRFRRLESVITGRWKLPAYLGGTVLKECESVGLYSEVSGVLPSCSSSSGGSYVCDPPPACNSLPCLYEQETVYTGVDQFGPEDAFAAAEAASTTEEGTWSSWATGYPDLDTFVTALTNDTRGDVSCSFNERWLTIQFAGGFSPFMLRRKERHSFREPLGPPAVITDHVIDVEVLDGSELVIEWLATANTTKTLLASEVLLPQ
jgi:hypothetical protein